MLWKVTGFDDEVIYVEAKNASWASRAAVERENAIRQSKFEAQIDRDGTWQGDEGFIKNASWDEVKDDAAFETRTVDHVPGKLLPELP